MGYAFDVGIYFIAANKPCFHYDGNGNIHIMKLSIQCLFFLSHTHTHAMRSADEGFDGTYHTNVVVKSNGSCLYVPPGKHRQICIRILRIFSVSCFFFQIFFPSSIFKTSFTFWIGILFILSNDPTISLLRFNLKWINQALQEKGLNAHNWMPLLLSSFFYLTFKPSFIIDE